MEREVTQENNHFRQPPHNPISRKRFPAHVEETGVIHKGANTIAHRGGAEIIWRVVSRSLRGRARSAPHRDGGHLPQTFRTFLTYGGNVIIVLHSES